MKFVKTENQGEFYVPFLPETNLYQVISLNSIIIDLTFIANTNILELQ